MAATLGLVDKNQGSPHPVPSLLEHHLLKSKLSKDMQAMTGLLYSILGSVSGGWDRGSMGNPAGKLPME